MSVVTILIFGSSHYFFSRFPSIPDTIAQGVNRIIGGKFEHLSGTSYYKNRVSVYFENHLIDGADERTFVVLRDYYAKDKNSVYIHGRKVAADVVSFEALDGDYAKDRNRVYYLGAYTISDRPEEFEVFYTSRRLVKIIQDNRFLNAPSNYGRTLLNVFYNGMTISNADVPTFQVLKNEIAKDLTRVYINGEPSSEIYDAETFEILAYDSQEPL